MVQLLGTWAGKGEKEIVRPAFLYRSLLLGLGKQLLLPSKIKE